jgi:hypothetical protein
VRPQRVSQILQLLALLWQYDLNGRKQSQKIAFELPENEVNDYLTYALRLVPRPGIQRLTVRLLPRSEVRATAVIDFDAVERWNPGTIPLQLRPTLTGRNALQIDARFESHNGTLTLELKDIFGPEQKLITKQVALAIIRSIGSRQPEQYDASGPLQLPFGIQRVWTENHLLCGET